MKEPVKIKLTDSPTNKKVNLTPLPSLEDKYPDRMIDDIYPNPNKFKTFWKTHSVDDNENNQQDNSESIQ